MSTSSNKHGLSRDIPADVRRDVRRACGFGCVTCGLPIYQYEHFDPPFAEAREHRVDGIALLCGSCHDAKTRGLWSAEKIAEARKAPVTFRKGAGRQAFDLASPLRIRVGSSYAENTSAIVKTHEGEQWFSMEPPELPGAPVMVTAHFFDSNGAPSLSIEANAWSPALDQWDTEFEGKTIRVRRAARVIALELSAMPPNGLMIVRLDMERRGVRIRITPDGIVAVTRDGDTTTMERCGAIDTPAMFII
jgi:hypothetical protein